ATSRRPPRHASAALLLCTARVVLGVGPCKLKWVPVHGARAGSHRTEFAMLDQAQRRDAGAKLTALARTATQAVEALLADATAAVRRRVTVDRQVADRLLDAAQRATSGLAGLATYVEWVPQLAAYAERMNAADTLGEVEELLAQIGIGEYLAQIQGGIPMSRGEIVRPADVGLATEAVAARMVGPLQAFASGNVERRARLIELMRAHHHATVRASGLGETLATIRDEMRQL